MVASAEQYWCHHGLLEWSLLLSNYITISCEIKKTDISHAGSVRLRLNVKKSDIRFTGELPVRIGASRKPPEKIHNTLPIKMMTEAILQIAPSGVPVNQPDRRARNRLAFLLREITIRVTT